MRAASYLITQAAQELVPRADLAVAQLRGALHGTELMKRYGVMMLNV
jgi:hypothetical protein